jgi:protein translocase SecG subunit
MKEILIISQIIISILLALAILMQNKGMGLSSTFGGGSDSGFYSSKRGVEKLLSQITIVLAFLFVANAGLYMYLY